jgi:hypothetical protein
LTAISNVNQLKEAQEAHRRKVQFLTRVQRESSLRRRVATSLQQYASQWSDAVRCVADCQRATTHLTAHVWMKSER